ncbi:MAG: ATP synthase F1 subunit delta [Candidatus Gracilibacteria bacterium]|nr:ATP synthase F1 subunit delta [Candidatus Gracilibacteria bacterium]MDD5179180.1 ATP synthase F1 subunit delta [Candidatus Gracilibacteria bacterium]
MSKISLRYSRALFTALGSNAKTLQSAAEELDLAAEVIGSSEAQDFFANPRVEEAKKIKALEKTFGDAKKEILNTLKLLAQNGKMSEVKAVAESFQRVIAEAGVVSAKIESAVKLDKTQLEKITAALKKMTGKEITVETSENPALIGGIRISLGDEVIDLSTAGKLSKLAQTLS